MKVIVYQCLKCGCKFNHYFRGGDPKDPLSYASSQCPECLHLYLKILIEPVITNKTVLNQIEVINE